MSNTTTAATDIINIPLVLRHQEYQFKLLVNHKPLWIVADTGSSHAIVRRPDATSEDGENNIKIKTAFGDGQTLTITVARVDMRLPQNSRSHRRSPNMLVGRSEPSSFSYSVMGLAPPSSSSSSSSSTLFPSLYPFISNVLRLRPQHTSMHFDFTSSPTLSFQEKWTPSMENLVFSGEFVCPSATSRCGFGRCGGGAIQPPPCGFMNPETNHYVVKIRPVDGARYLLIDTGTVHSLFPEGSMRKHTVHVKDVEGRTMLLKNAYNVNTRQFGTTYSNYARPPAPNPTNEGLAFMGHMDMRRRRLVFDLPTRTLYIYSSTAAAAAASSSSVRLRKKNERRPLAINPFNQMHAMASAWQA